MALTMFLEAAASMYCSLNTAARNIRGVKAHRGAPRGSHACGVSYSKVTEYGVRSTSNVLRTWLPIAN